MSLWSHLWCQVLWCSTEGLHRGTVCDALFTQPKVCYLNVAILVQHEVFQLCTKRFIVSLLTWETCSTYFVIVRALLDFKKRASNSHLSNLYKSILEPVNYLPLNPYKLRCVSAGTPVLTLFLHHRIVLCLRWTLCPVISERKAARKKTQILDYITWTGFLSFRYFLFLCDHRLLL